MKVSINEPLESVYYKTKLWTSVLLYLVPLYLSIFKLRWITLLLKRPFYLLLLSIIITLTSSSPNTLVAQTSGLPSHEILLKSTIEAIKNLRVEDTTTYQRVSYLFRQYKKGNIVSDTIFDALHDMINENSLFIQDKAYQELLRSAVHVSRIAQNLNEEALFLLIIANNFLEKEQLDSSRMRMSELEKIKEKTDFTMVEAKYFLYVANTASLANNYLKSLEYYLYAREKFASIDHRIALAVVDYSLGNMYHQLENYPKAIKYIKAAYDYYITNEFTQSLTDITTNLGVLHMRLGSLDSASHFLNISLKLAKEHNVKISIARVYTNLANVYRRQGLYKKAIEAIESSDAICNENDIYFGLLLNKINLAEIYLEAKDFPTALALLLDAKKNVEIYNNLYVESEIYETLYSVYEKLGNYKEAFQSLTKYNELRENVVGIDTERRLYEWENRTQQLKNEKQISELNHSILLSKLRSRRFYSILIIIVIAILAFSYYLYTQKQTALLKEILLLEESEMLKNQMKRKDRELISLSMNLKSLFEFAKNIKSRLLEVKRELPVSRRDVINKLLQEFETGIPEPLWKDFKLRFEEIHQEFYQKLLDICPELTPAEIKMASYLRMNLSSKEIASLTNRTIGTVSNTRSSLRKKLDLDSDDNLTSFLISL